MNDASVNVVAMLEVLADLDAKIRDLALSVRSRQGVIGGSQWFACRRYEAGPMVECYLEVELANDREVCFWLDIVWDIAGWRIDSRVSVTYPGGQDTLHDASEPRVGTLEECIVNINVVSARMFSRSAFFEEMLDRGAVGGLG